MMLFWMQQGPAQTANYFIAGYAVIFGVIGLYLVSLAIRRRNLLQDLDALEEMQGGKS